MDIDPQVFFQILENHTKDKFKGPSECYRLLTILNHNLTEEQLHSSVIDQYLMHVFNKSNGLFNFIIKVCSSTEFENATMKSLEIIYTLINNFSSKVEQYILEINDQCLIVLRTKTAAKIKVKCLEVLLISLEKVDVCLENQQRYLAVFEGLKTCLMQGIHRDSVRQNEFTAVGLFAKRFSYLIYDPKSIKKYFIIQLDSEMTKGPAQSIICGIFTGLNYFCDSFPLSLDNPEDVTIVMKLYRYVKELSVIDCQKRYGNRAAMIFFSSNINLFKNNVIKEYKQWHKVLLVKWLRMGSEERKVGEQTLRVLLLSIAEALVDMNEKDCMPVLTHFVGWFKSIFRNENATFTEKKLCVQGLKYFGSPLYKHFSKENAQEVFLLIMQNFERLYILVGNSEDEWEFLPDYVQCLASFMRYQTFTNSEVYCLQRAVINMIKTFHNLKPLHHTVVIDALVSTLFYLMKTKHFDAFLENIVYQGVVWSCSHQHASDSELASEKERIITVKNYFSLWRGLLRMVSNCSYDKISIYFSDREYILAKLVSELVKTLMILINKLNVNVQIREEIIETDIETAYQVEHSSDFAIFLNVTDFYKEIFEHVDPDMFKDCICKMINHLVAKCLKYHLVSGFYKLLSFALKISNKLKLFDKDNITLNQDVANSKETLSKFLTFLLHKMKQFKDELLISCMLVLLECPVIVAEPLLKECIGVFITVFELGRSYIALANMGLSTLQRWQSCMDKQEFEAFLLQVIPSLDSYLRSKSLGGIVSTASIEKKRKTARGLRKRTVLVELEPELVKFQKKVLRFVGSQNSKICEAFVSPDNSFERKVTSDNLHLKVTLPYDDIALEVYVEPFIMRVVELSLYSSDRKTRVMACELLQAFVMVFLGTTKQLTYSSLSDLDDLFKNIASALLQLACDVDQVVRQIFEPLFLQLIHWYTAKLQRESPHLAVIIEVLMEGVTHPINSSLRDFSGKCFNEFVKWTIKQRSEKELKNNPINIKILVKKIRFFSGHPDLVKKLGAALIFNNIYKEIREERALISIFALELLHIFLGSLALLETSSEEVDRVVIQINNAIGHLRRIFVEKPQVFRDIDDLRRVPFDIEEGTLKGLCKWILRMTASRSKYCRDVSMDLFIHLQPLSGTNQNLSTFVNCCYREPLSLYTEPLSERPTLEHLTINEDSTQLLKWLQMLLCLLDGYVFIVKNSLASIALDRIESVVYFLKYIQTSSMEQALRLIYKNAPLPFYTAQNKDQFSILKASCCLSIMKLAVAILNDEILCNSAYRRFWNHHFWHLVLNFIFNPSLLGFEVQASQPDCSDVLLLFLNTISRKMDNKLVMELVTVLRNYVNDHFSVDIDLKRNVSLKQRNILKGLLTIQSTRLNTLFKAECYSQGLIDKLLACFLASTQDNTMYAHKLSALTIEHCSLIFQFALQNDQELITLVEYLYKDVSVNCQEMSHVDNQVTFGLYLLSKFADPIAKFLLENFEKFLPGTGPGELAVKLTDSLLKYMGNNKDQFKDNFEKVFSGILDNWKLFELYFEENCVDSGLDFVSQLWKFSGTKLIYNDNVQNWVTSLITREQVPLTELGGVNFYLNVFNVLAEVVTDEGGNNLTVALEKLRLIFEPAASTNLENNTLTEKLLINLPLVKNQTIFEFLLNFYADFTPKINRFTNLEHVLAAFMMKNLDRDQGKILQTCYDLTLNDNKTFDQKRLLVDNVLPFIFKNARYEKFESFFEANIKQIMERLLVFENYGNGLVDFLLIELLFWRIPVGAETRINCSIVRSSGNPKLRAVLLKAALDAFKNAIEGDKEQLRIYKCGAYKALASIISNSIRKEIFYEKLFMREENDEDILWRALIDCDVRYEFAVDFDSYPKKRKMLINIRDELREHNQQNRSKSLRYIESQRLFNSSLSEDITKFDFTTSVLRSGAIDSSNDDSNEETNVKTEIKQGEIYLEATEINNHELMATVCGVIEHIFSSGVSRLPEDDEMMEIPKWMEGIRHLLCDSGTHKNIKIFWVKVIDNMVHIFKHFARYFLEPLLRFLNDKIGGDDLNYFVTDVIVILVSWTGSVQPNETESKLASNFVNQAVKALVNDRQDAFKYNLDLVKLLVENWREFIQVPYEALYTKINYGTTDRKIEVGIHLTSVFLVNDLLPCEEKNIDAFWTKLMQILASDVTTIYKPCAETLGLMLKYFKKFNMPQIALAAAASKAILSFQEVNKYASCLEAIAIHYPELVDEYHLMKMLNRLSQSDKHLQITFLKIIHKRASVLGDVASFKTEDWCKYLESPNAEIQLICLEIILKTFSILKDELSFKSIVKSVCKNLLNPNIFCRGKMFDILIAILKDDGVNSQDIIEQCKEVLIQGLIDNDVETREKVREFWSENPSLPSSISSRFPYLMLNFYLAKAEDHFLGYISYFLLDALKNEYEKEIFEHPLEDCDFEEYKLQTNWRLQHPSVVPMFAETLRTYSEGLDDISLDNFEKLRATQNNLTFAPTQQSMRDRHISQITSLESSLIGSSLGRSEDANFVNPNTINLSQRYKLPKRRFLKDRTKISANYANLAVAEKIQKTFKRYDAVKEKENKVTIYRSYRKGDFPDIQITLGSLIKPLQMLVLHDGELSKTFFSVMYKILKDKARNINEEFSNTILESIKCIFTTSVQYNVNVFSTLFDILLKSKKEFRIDPGLISSVCQQSGLISVGTLLIEEYLMTLDDVSTPAKRGIGSEDVETRHWLKLAELYKELHEWNLVRIIFLEKSDCKEEVHKAIALESEKKWREAEEQYKKLLQIDLSHERQDFYYESYFKCLAHLGEWETLPKAVELLVPESGEKTWSSLWDNDWFQQKILPWYVGAKVKNILFADQVDSQFLTDISRSLCNQEQADYLKNKFAEELCILWLTQKDTAQATQYLATSLDNFLSEWQLLNPMFGNLRYNKILDLRTLVEIDRFLNTSMNLTEDYSDEHVKCLLDYWKTTQEEYMPSIILSEAKLLYRKLFNKLLVNKLRLLDKIDLVKELTDANISLDISFMNLSVQEGNFYMTRKYYKQYASRVDHNSLTMIRGELAHLFANLVNNDPELKLKKLLEGHNKFKEVAQSVNNDKVITSLLKVFDISQKITEVLLNNPQLDVKQLIDVDYATLRSELLKNDFERETSEQIDEKCKALVKLAYFVQDREGQDRDFVLFVLHAMRLGSRQARQLFPCILLKESLQDDLEDTFVRETEQIPTWMFLGWIPQLLANVDSSKVSAISDIVLRIAKTYPQAIMYSYRLSKESIPDSEDLYSEESKQLIDELDQLLLSDPLVDKFLTGLSKVSVPLIKLQYYLQRMLNCQQVDDIVKIKDELIKSFFEETGRSMDESDMQGKTYRCVKDFKNDFQKINSRDAFAKVKTMLDTIYVKCQKVLAQQVSSRNGISKILKEYCPWLANFSAGRMNMELEIPGQYTGEKLPLVQHHVKISGFCETVSVMSSLRKPIKVTILGMDSKEYPFLIKFGEDIRQDQRIQQLFMLMNSIFASDNRSHHVLTYQVIPLTSSLGIIQWVENTVSLEDFIKRSLPIKDREKVFDALRTKYQSFLGRERSAVDLYGQAAVRKDRNTVIPFYLGLTSEIPHDIIRTSIWSLSLTTESFIAFRDNFIKSYGAICACQWILGIGDRHLQNSKVCVRNGKVLGIDFGCAFGTGTQILRVPELVPIRLTPHIVNLMEPLREKGAFRDVMIECLRSLRSNSSPLLATMNVFIQEPSLEWLENARRFEKSDASGNHQWYPLQKIDQAKKKLQGAASKDILIDDLKWSSYYQTHPKYFKAYISLVEGNALFDKRARLNDKQILSVEEQVDSLIDHATDRNLLGRMYAGWNAAV